MSLPPMFLQRPDVETALEAFSRGVVLPGWTLDEVQLEWRRRHPVAPTPTAPVRGDVKYGEVAFTFIRVFGSDANIKKFFTFQLNEQFRRLGLGGIDFAANARISKNTCTVDLFERRSGFIVPAVKLAGLITLGAIVSYIAFRVILIVTAKAAKTIVDEAEEIVSDAEDISDAANEIDLIVDTAVEDGELSQETADQIKDRTNFIRGKSDEIIESAQIIIRTVPILQAQAGIAGLLGGAGLFVLLFIVLAVGGKE